MLLKDLKIGKSLLMELGAQQGTSLGPFVTIGIEYPIPQELQSAFDIGVLHIFPHQIKVRAFSKVVELSGQ